MYTRFEDVKRKLLPLLSNILNQLHAISLTNGYLKPLFRTNFCSPQVIEIMGGQYSHYFSNYIFSTNELLFKYSINKNILYIVTFIQVLF